MRDASTLPGFVCALLHYASSLFLCLDATRREPETEGARFKIVGSLTS